MKKRTWQKEIARFDIHTKTGKEKFLAEVARAYESMYPERSAYFKWSLRQLRQVTTDGYQAGRAGDMRVSIRVPTELWMFIQRWIPDFGDDSSDIQLLARVWCDLVCARKDHRRRTRLVVPRDYGVAEPEPKDAEGSGEKGKTVAAPVHAGDKGRTRRQRRRGGDSDLGDNDRPEGVGLSAPDAGVAAPAVAPVR